MREVATQVVFDQEAEVEEQMEVVEDARSMTLQGSDVGGYEEASGSYPRRLDGAGEGGNPNQRLQDLLQEDWREQGLRETATQLQRCVPVPHSARG